MNQRFRYASLVIRFALHVLWLLLIEKKIMVAWSREGKIVSLHVCFYNHLFDEEVPQDIND